MENLKELICSPYILSKKGNEHLKQLLSKSEITAIEFDKMVNSGRNGKAFQKVLGELFVNYRDMLETTRGIIEGSVF